MGFIKALDPEIINSFLNRKLNNWDWIKELSEDELDQKITALDPVPVFPTQLRKEQKAMFLIGVQQTNFIYLAYLGTGKTLLSLSLFNYYKQIGRAHKALILVPNIVLIQGWIDEINKHTPDLTAIGLYGPKHQRLELLEKPADIYILNYAGLQAILCSSVSITKKKKKRVIIPADIIQFARMFDFVAYDEITVVKTPTSHTHVICDIISQAVPYKYGLTGIPIGRNPIDFWGEFKVIDGGQTLSNDFFRFRNIFFAAVKMPWAVEWKFKKKLTKDLHRILKNKSIRFKIEDKPYTKENIILRVPFPAETLAYFNKANSDLEDAISKGEIEKLKVSFIKLRQIASGFLNVKDDEGNNERIVFEDNPKIDLLVEKLKELPENCKAIVFHEFIFTGEQITKALTASHIKHRWIYGGTSNKNKLQALLDFKKDPNVNVLVLNSASGAMGLNLQHSSYEFFLERNVSPIINEQAEGRIDRPGQTKPIFIIDIVVKNSKDEDILRFLQEGKDLLQSLIEGTKKGVKE